MYEAPDRYKRMISARLPDGESLGVASQAADEGSSPLRDAQLIARGQFAPFFAIANSIAAVMMAMILYGHVPASYLGGWAVAVIVATLRAAGRRYLLVTETTMTQTPMKSEVPDTKLRGLFSASRIEQALDAPLPDDHQSRSFAELRVALDHA